MPTSVAGRSSTLHLARASQNALVHAGPSPLQESGGGFDQDKTSVAGGGFVHKHTDSVWAGCGQRQVVEHTLHHSLGGFANAAILNPFTDFTKDIAYAIEASMRPGHELAWEWGRAPSKSKPREKTTRSEEAYGRSCSSCSMSCSTMAVEISSARDLAPSWAASPSA